MRSKIHKEDDMEELFEVHGCFRLDTKYTHPQRPKESAMIMYDHLVREYNVYYVPSSFTAIDKEIIYNDEYLDIMEYLHPPAIATSTLAQARQYLFDHGYRTYEYHKYYRKYWYGEETYE